MKKEILRINHLNKKNGSTYPLYDIHLNLFEGELLCLTGARKSGKSLLVKIMNGKVPMDSGNYLIGETPVDRKKLRLGAIQDIRIVGPQSALVPELTVAENLFLFNLESSRPHFINRRRLNQRADALLALTAPLLEIQSSQYVSELSSCQKQCLEILRHIVNQASVIVLDDSCSLFTYREFMTMLEFIKSLCEKKFSFIYVCNEPDPVLEQSDRIAILRNGRNAGLLYIEDYNKEKLLRIFTGMAVPEISPILHNPISTSDNQTILQLSSFTGHAKLKTDIHIKPGSTVGFLTSDLSVAKELQLLFTQLTQHPCHSHYRMVTNTYIWSIWKGAVNTVLEIPQDTENNMLCDSLTILENLELFLNRPFSKKLVPTKKQLKLIGEELDGLMGRSIGWSARTLAKDSDKTTQKQFMILRCLFTSVDILLLSYPGRELKVRYTEFLREQNTALIMITDSIPELLASCDDLYIFSNQRISSKIDCKATTKEEVLKLWLET